jgi:6-pyruvoyltetrahydropterin/6-carboxytetrahydropterin synthase
VIITEVVRYHDFSYGHRILGEGKCTHLHGHNARVYLTFQGRPDNSGHIIDFSDVKRKHCAWLEGAWDHRMVLFKEDPLLSHLLKADSAFFNTLGLRVVDFNPTAENMASFSMREMANHFDTDTVKLTHIKWEETRKCSVSIGIVAERNYPGFLVP